MRARAEESRGQMRGVLCLCCCCQVFKFTLETRVVIKDP